MNNEIKEILEFKENADYKKLSCDEIKVLKDYITNLQEEQLEDYKSRIEKAVEYIDVITNKSIYESGYGKGTAITICKEHLLDILNGKE